MKKEEITKITGKRIKQLRKQRNLTQEQLGKYLNLNRPVIANWERGDRNPTLDQFNKLAELFNVSIDYLVGREEAELNDDGASIECYRLLRKLKKNKHFRENYPHLLLDDDRFIDLEPLNQKGVEYIRDMYRMLLKTIKYTQREN